MHEIDEHETINLGDLKVSAWRVEHGELNALSFRVEAEGRVFCYSGDSGACENLVKAARDADLFLCECSIPAAYPAMPGVHLTSAEVGQVATRAGARRVVLTHLYPQADEVDILAEVKGHYAGVLERAEDGASFQV